MQLAVDIGNTNVVAGIFKGSDFVTSWRFETERGKTADEWWALLATLMQQEGIDPNRLDGMAIGSGVPRLTATFRGLCRRRLGRDPIEVRAGVDLGIANQTEMPDEVGPDRLANAVAAISYGPGPWVVIDFGTATTLDVVARDGAYLGGPIAPGVMVALEGLTAHAAQLSSVPLEVPARAIGRNTTEAMQAGIVLGYVGLIEGLLTRITHELGETPRVIATGGLGELFAGQIPAVERYDPNHTLIGLNLVYLRIASTR
ncbi:MAG TPA: type III pantothenate kinase [Thermomicrobiaceae bacterium]|nr:type III pantothenate kinase [Thermomicrobiaceae bacterium]